MRPKKRPLSAWLALRNGVEVALIRGAFAVIACLPRRWLMAWARGLGAVACRVVPLQRRIALANLQLAFGDEIGPDRREALVRASFTSFFRVIFDYAWFSRHSAERIRRWVRFEPELERLLAISPSIIVTAHFGNWEVLGQAGSRSGSPVVSVAALFRNESLNRFITALRERGGMTITPREGALLTLFKALKEGSRVALLMDQNTRLSEGGVFVRFFGRPVTQSKAASLLSIRTGAPILPVFCLAEPDGSYRAYAGPLLKPAEADGQAGLDQAVASAIEAEIRAHPEQWLWMYRRWKYVPPGEAADGFPFYSHTAT